MDSQFQQALRDPAVVARGPRAVTNGTPGAPASVIVPAHDEESVVARCLEALARDAIARQCEVIVVANGCSDATADVARSFDRRLERLRVLEITEAGKIGALNAGDDLASVFPRVYLDADVVLEPGSFEPLVAGLSTDRPVAAAPSISFDVDRSSRPVRAFYRAYTELPYVRDGLVGLGVYGISERGRQRFGRFPDVVADDLFVQRCFGDDERITTAGVFTVRVPRTVRDLVRVRRRSTGGALELTEKMAHEASVDSSSTTRATLAALGAIVRRRPQMAGAAFVYLLVNLMGRMRPVRESQRWTRDDSTRNDVAGPTVVELDGLPLWSATRQDVVEHVMACLESGQGGIIATPNVDILRHHLRGDDTVLDKIDVLVPDGMPLLWASKIQGEPLRERIPGSDLVWALSMAAAEHHRSVFLLGGAEGVAERAAQAFQLLRPHLQIAGTASPPRGFEGSTAEMSALRAQLFEAQPDVVFVALGNPRQERLALSLRDALPRTWFLGCGGSFDMAAGDQVRAPVVLQRLGLEWVHRLRLEPGRLWRRYLVDDLPFALGMMVRAGQRRLCEVRASLR